MIDAKEIRIGSLLMWEDESCDIVSITGIRKTDTEYLGDNYAVDYHDMGGKGSGSAMLQSFIPISLTAEWLERCGFVARGVFMIYKHHARIRFYVNDGQILLYIDDNIFPSPIECVHQVQNLYFALTGMELEEKL